MAGVGQSLGALTSREELLNNPTTWLACSSSSPPSASARRAPRRRSAPTPRPSPSAPCASPSAARCSSLVARAAPAAAAALAAAGARRPIAAAIAVYQLAFFAAVDRTGVAVGTVVALGSAPAIAGVAGRLIDREPLTGRWAAATALACAGVLLLVLGGGGASVDPLGIMLAVVSGSGYATYTVLAKRMLRLGHAPERVMAASFSLGARAARARAGARRRRAGWRPATGSRWRCSSARSRPRWRTSCSRAGCAT